MENQMPEMGGYAATGVIRNELGLHALPGDREACIAAGIHALYARTARDFLNIIASTYSDLKTQLEVDDQQLAITTLHTLNGNAETLAVAALAMEAKRLKQLCRSEHVCEKCLQELNHLRDCIGQAQSLLKVAIEALALGPEKPTEPAGSMPQPADTGALSRALEALESLLQHSDMDALEVFAASRSQLVGLPDELHKRLDDALQALDFEAAHQACLEQIIRASPDYSA
jgi:HPt (histidine-containing phosphotransfer) domain-containing protein